MLAGDRSVMVPSGGVSGSGGIKIKGAGYRDGRVGLGKPHGKPYAHRRPERRFLTRLAYYSFDTNFILAQFAADSHLRKVADRRGLARSTYLRSLTGQVFSPAPIGAFKACSSN